MLQAFGYLSGFLTAQKAYYDPGSETLSTWILAGISGFLAMLAVGRWDIVLLSYPFYIIVINIVVIGAILLGSKKKLKNNPL